MAIFHWRDDVLQLRLHPQYSGLQRICSLFKYGCSLYTLAADVCCCFLIGQLFKPRDNWKKPLEIFQVNRLIWFKCSDMFFTANLAFSILPSSSLHYLNVVYLCSQFLLGQYLSNFFNHRTFLNCNTLVYKLIDTCYRYPQGCENMAGVGLEDDVDVWGTSWSVPSWLVSGWLCSCCGALRWPHHLLAAWYKSQSSAGQPATSLCETLGQRGVSVCLPRVRSVVFWLSRQVT